MLLEAIKHTFLPLGLQGKLPYFRDLHRRNELEVSSIPQFKKILDDAGVSAITLPFNTTWLEQYGWERPIWLIGKDWDGIHLFRQNQSGSLDHIFCDKSARVSHYICRKDKVAEIASQYDEPHLVIWLGDSEESSISEKELILFEPDESLKGRPFRRFLKMLRPDRKDVGYIYLYAILAGLINLSLPLGIQAIINLINSGEITTSWYILILFILIGIIFNGGFQIMQLYIIEVMQQRVFVRAAFQFARKIPRINLEGLGRNYPPELINRFFDILTVQKGLSKVLMDFSSSTLQIIFGLFLLSFYHPFFIAFGFILLITLVVIFRYSGRLGLVTSLEESKYKYKVVFWLEEVARNLVSFKLSGQENLVSEKTDELVTGYVKYRKAHFNVLLFQFANAIIFKALVTGGLLIMGSMLVMDQEMNIGQFVAAEIVIILLLVAVEKLIRTMETVYDILTATEKLGQVIDLKEEKTEGVDFVEHDTRKGLDLELRNLTYQFEDMEAPILNNINLKIASGQRLCISGTNRSGKSTMIKILSGLFTGYQGAYLVNGVPASGFVPSTFRQMIGDNLAEEDIFYGTLAENLSMGRSSILRKQMMEAIEVVGLGDFIKELPQGLDTVVAPEDKRFTPSLSRKIILARSLVCKPRLLVIDDYLLNAELERVEAVTRYLTDAENEWTLVVVSNNAYMAKSCNRVVVLDKGKIAVEGTADDIFKTPYRTLFNVKQD